MTTAPITQRIRRLVPPPADPAQAAIAVVAATAFIVYLAVHSGVGKPKPTTAAPAATPGAAPSAIPAGPAAVTPARLGALAAAAGRRIYWVGPRAGTTYELTRKGTELFLRYLPSGVPVGDKGLHLTIGTYPEANAYAMTRNAASEPGAVRLKVGGGGVAFYRPSRPESVYVAFPHDRAQLEVYSPDPAQARRLATGGKLRPVPGSPTAVRLQEGVPVAVTPADLRTLSADLAQPIYWIGTRPGTTYELTRRGTNLFLRYLHRGVPVGSGRLAPTIGTYRVANAYDVTAAAAANQDATRVDVGPNAAAFYRTAHPQSVYVAFRGQPFQIEVYDPSAAEALRLATTGQLRLTG
jgi:hypothetical protein